MTAFQSDAFSYSAFQADAVNAINATELTVDVVDINGSVSISLKLLSTEANKDGMDINGTVAISMSLLANEPVGLDTMASVAAPGTLWTFEEGSDTMDGEGDSEGFIIYIPRDVSGGIAYLIEMKGYNPVTSAEQTLRYASMGYNTKSTDSVPNVHYLPNVKVPGDFSRSFFSDGTTAGSVSVGAGIVELINLDGRLDRTDSPDNILYHAFDGREIRIYTISRLNPVYADKILIFKGTVEQVEFTWERARIRMRDRLAELDKPLQTVLFDGTTISGALTNAEGKPDDLKDKPKPLTYGEPLSVPGAMSNTFNNIFDVGQNGIFNVVEVRDRGVLLTYNTDFATVALLKAATIPSGRYATCKTAGLIRTSATPNGQVTIRPQEGASAAERSAAQIARRMLLRMGMVEGTDFLASDVTKLDALNAAPIGYWVGTEEQTCLTAVSEVLNSIGAAIVPDRLGVYRMYRLEAPPITPPVITLRMPEILEASSRGIERIATQDEGAGVQAWKITIKYGKNYVVLSKSDLDIVNTSDAFKSFASEEWRTAVAKDDAVKLIHTLASEMTFESYLINEADAIAEVTRRLNMYKVRRDRFKVPIKSYIVERVDINSVVGLEAPRFGLEAGKNFKVIGLTQNNETGNTVLDLWG